MYYSLFDALSLECQLKGLPLSRLCLVAKKYFIIYLYISIDSKICRVLGVFLRFSKY
jgi:hypothetical protein